MSNVSVRTYLPYALPFCIFLCLPISLIAAPYLAPSSPYINDKRCELCAHGPEKQGVL